MSASLILRTVKGAPLTNLEVDNNFSNLNAFGDLIDSNVGVLSNLTTANKSNIVAAINELQSESTSNVTITGGTISGVVLSDTSGSNVNISSGNINITGGTVDGVIVTQSTWQGNTIDISYGGTGQTSRAAAINALLPVQTNNSTYILRTDGTNLSWTLDQINISDDTVTDSTLYVPFTSATTGNISSFSVSSTKLNFNPSTGVLASTDYNSLSDITLKENIRQIEDPINILSKITGIEFTWKDNGLKSYGLSAQEVETVLPDIVRERNDGTKGINYMNLIAFLVEAIKDLKQEIQELKSYK